HAQATDPVRVNRIQEFGRIRTLYFDPAERGHIDDTDVAAHVRGFTLNGLSLGFAGVRIEPRPAPDTDIHEYGARSCMAGIHRRTSQRPKRFATPVAGHRAQRN